MRLGRRKEPLVSVIVPVYNVADYLDECLESVLGQSHRELQVVVVDDGSTDDSGDRAESWSRRDPRVEVHHTPNAGLGAARNEGARHVRGDFVAYVDSDDRLPPDALELLVRALSASSADFVVGSMARWESGTLTEPPWMRRLHHPTWCGRPLEVHEHPEILGDVFAWNKLYRAAMLTDGADASPRGLAWPEGVRYEDQPATTRAYLDRRFLLIPDVVYHWRIRDDGTSITQAAGSLRDLGDRMLTKRWVLDDVTAYAAQHSAPQVLDMLLDRVLAGDLHRWFHQIPGCADDWWDLLVSSVHDLWRDRSLAQSGLPPVHRVCGVLVQAHQREVAERLMVWVRTLAGAPAPRGLENGEWVLQIPQDVVPEGTVPDEVFALRDYERG